MPGPEVVSGILEPKFTFQKNLSDGDRRRKTPFKTDGAQPRHLAIYMRAVAISVSKLCLEIIISKLLSRPEF
jgi:hypothetical protein